jgi:aryl-alcohol dehydrogenase-like predicted oxidoreductase
MGLNAEPPVTKVRRLCDTGLQVSPLSFGSMLIGADQDSAMAFRLRF